MYLYNPGNVTSILELNWSSALLYNSQIIKTLLRLGTTFWIMCSPEILELIIHNIHLADHEGRWENFPEMPVQTSDNNSFAEKNTDWSVKTIIVPRSENWGRAKGNSEEDALSIPGSNIALTTWWHKCERSKYAQIILSRHPQSM